jgi:osmotically-inducible protein OsmY
MPESRTEEKKTRPVYQDLHASNLGLELRETDCLDIPQAPAAWRVVEGEKSSNEGLQTFVALPLQTGQKVYCEDGYAGKVIALRLSPEGDLQAFVVQMGRFFRRRYVVPYEWVSRIEEENVYISANKDDVKALPEERPDSALVIDVERALWEDVVLAGIESNRIDVSARSGAIGLQGYISNSAQKARAGEVARQVPGVLSIQNCLVVDVDLKLAAARAVAKVPRGQRGRIFVNAHNGFVILNGEVPTIEAREAAEAQAGEVPLIRGILNSIRVPDAGIEFPEPRAIQPRIGAEVYAKDMALGTVERVIVNPVNRLVVAILVDGSFPDPKDDRTHWFPGDGALVRRKVVIPIHAIRHLTDTAVLLDINSREASRLEDFDPDDFALPEASWRPPYPYRCEDVLLWKPSEKKFRSISVPIQFERQEV